MDWNFEIGMLTRDQLPNSFESASDNGARIQRSCYYVQNCDKPCEFSTPCAKSECVRVGPGLSDCCCNDG